tara:strand:- start:10398 stop:10529 length:132 start_codon:yes stop_codon:yes gene_type:complete
MRIKDFLKKIDYEAVAAVIELALVIVIAVIWLFVSYMQYEAII